MPKPARKPRHKHGRTAKYPRQSATGDQHYWRAPIPNEIRTDSRQLELFSTAPTQEADREAAKCPLDEIAIHLAAADDSAWASPPARPMLDRDGNAIRDPKTGKIKFAGLVAFTTANVCNAWSKQIIQALHLRFPEALANGDSEPEEKNPLSWGP